MKLVRVILPFCCGISAFTLQSSGFGNSQVLDILKQNAFKRQTTQAVPMDPRVAENLNLARDAGINRFFRDEEVLALANFMKKVQDNTEARVRAERLISTTSLENKLMQTSSSGSAEKLSPEHYSSIFESIREIDTVVNARVENLMNIMKKLDSNFMILQENQESIVSELQIVSSRIDEQTEIQSTNNAAYEAAINEHTEGLQGLDDWRYLVVDQIQDSRDSLGFLYEELDSVQANSVMVKDLDIQMKSVTRFIDDLNLNDTRLAIDHLETKFDKFANKTQGAIGTQRARFYSLTTDVQLQTTKLSELASSIEDVGSKFAQTLDTFSHQIEDIEFQLSEKRENPELAEEMAKFTSDVTELRDIVQNNIAESMEMQMETGNSINLNDMALAAVDTRVADFTKETRNKLQLLRAIAEKNSRTLSAILRRRSQAISIQ